MTKARRIHKWDTQSTDVVPVMRALAPFVHAAGKSWSETETKGYDISGQSAHLSGVDDFDDAARRLGDVTLLAVLEYQSKLTLRTAKDWPRYEIRLEVQKGYGPHSSRVKPDSTVSVKLEMRGPDEDAATGLMNRVRNQFDSEITRLDPRAWSASGLDAVVPPPTVAATTQQSSKSGFWTTSRKWIAGVITAVLTAVLIQIATDLVKRETGPAAPASTTATTPVSNAPLSRPAFSPAP